MHHNKENCMRLDFIIRNNIFKKVIEHVDNKNDNKEEFEFLIGVVESYLDSIGLNNMIIDRVIHNVDGIDNTGCTDSIDMIFTDEDDTIVYSVHIIEGLHIQSIKRTVDIEQETIGNIKTACINTKTYLINKEITFNIDFDVK